MKTKTKGFLLTAGFVLAMAFTFSCEDKEAKKVAEAAEAAAAAAVLSAQTAETKENEETLCVQNEDVLISFKMEKSPKTVSICIEKNDKYIVYRYGTKEKTELEFPENKANSWAKFTYETGWGKVYNGYSMNFINGGYRYSVHQSLNFDDYQKFDDITCRIGIVNISTEKVTFLNGAPESIIGGLVDLPDNKEDYRDSKSVKRLINNKKLLKRDYGYMNINADGNKNEYY